MRVHIVNKSNVFQSNPKMTPILKKLVGAIIENKGFVPSPFFKLIWNMKMDEEIQQKIPYVEWVEIFQMGKWIRISPFENLPPFIVKFMNFVLKPFVKNPENVNSSFELKILDLPNPDHVGNELKQLNIILNEKRILPIFKPIYMLHPMNGSFYFFLRSIHVNEILFTFYPCMEMVHITTPLERFEFTNEQDFKLYKNAELQKSSEWNSIYYPSSSGVHIFHKKDDYLLTSQSICQAIKIIQNTCSYIFYCPFA